MPPVHRARPASTPNTTLRRPSRRLSPSDENALFALETRDWRRVCGIILIVLLLVFGVWHLGA